MVSSSRSSVISLLALFSLSLTMLGCPRDPDEAEPPPAPDAPSAEAVAGHTSGTISRESTIRVRFTGDLVEEAALNQPLEPSPFDLKPPASGEAVWTGTGELQFQPDEPLRQGERYTVTVDVSVVPGLEGRVPPFGFDVEVFSQSFDVVVEGLSMAEAPSDDRQELSGRIITADLASPSEVEEMMSVEHGDDDLEVRWVHDLAERRHSFVIGGITRRETGSDVRITVDGGPIDVDDREELTVAVPGKSQFLLTRVSPVVTEAQHVEARFSDPLDEEQDLAGLVRSSDAEGLRFDMDGNILRIYSEGTWSEASTIVLEKGIRSAAGHRLAESSTETVHFAPPRPSVEFATRGVIIPTTGELKLPIETANLSALDVQAIRVPPENLPQFLQVNPLDGDREMRRVGEIVWRDTVDLRTSASRASATIEHGLDISPLLDDDPQGLYQIRLSFRPQHSLYECPPGTFRDDFVDRDPPEEVWGDESEPSHWDYFETQYADTVWALEPPSPWEMWRERKNPCHPAYYRSHRDHDISVTRNILVTDIGLIAKKGGDGSLFVAATDLRDAQPRSGAKIEVLDYQGREITTTWTKLDGTARVEPDRQPFFVLASHEGSEGIIRLREGSALAVGHLDVGGLQVSEGLKGLIYGERGVWRPGDDIFLTFILHDPSGEMPEDHPVRFELINSRGQTVHQSTRSSSLNGFYALRTRTEPDAPTGNYTARVHVGGATFEEVLKIETVMPNRLKIDLELDGDEDVIRGPDARLRATLRSAWLHGAVARNLKADVEMTLRPTTTTFDRFEGYTFDDPTRQLSPETLTVFDGTLDDRGTATIDEEFDTGRPPGMLAAHLSTRVFEPGGAFSIDSFTVPVSPYERYIGARTPPGDEARGMLLTDEKHDLQLVAVDADGELVDGVEVDVELYKMQWRWWWESGPEDLPDFTTSTSHTPLQRGTVKLENGRGVFEFEVEYPNWGRFLLLVRDREGGHRAGRIVYIDWPGWAGRGMDDQPGAASVLSVTADQPSYMPGDTATLTIPTPDKGRALVTLEDGSRVLSASWVEATGESTRHRIPIEADMAPGVYANVTLIQPHTERSNDLPMRLYGTVPIEVEDPKTRLSPRIQTTETFEPQSNATISVSEAEGREMTYTLAVVDEGLLGLTRFQTPDPWDRFYQREALGVTTWDVFDDVAGAFGGTFARLVAIGGDAPGAEGKEQSADRFPPVVRFLGPFQLEEAEQKEHSVAIPQYVGAVRVMVVAGQDGAFGNAEETVLVKKPLMLLATLPRVLGPGEEVDLPVSVFVLDDDLEEVTVTVETSDGINAIGDGDQVLSFSGAGDEMAGFRLETAQTLGVERVRVVATSGEEMAEQEIEIDIRHPGQPEVRILAGAVPAGESWSEEIALTGIGGTNDVSLEVSSIPPMNLSAHLDYLIGYPHGCLEQVMSRAFPQLHLARLVELGSAREAEVARNVNAGINRVSGHQTSGGGFTYWPSDDRAHDWTSSYVGHFLLEAQQAGHPVRSSILQRWESYQRRTAQAYVPSANGSSDLAQAYRLYTLALAGNAAMGAMNRLRESDDLSHPARWRLAAAYQLAGRTEVARRLAGGASTEGAEYDLQDATFGSSLRDMAMILETAVLLEDSRQVSELSRDISEELSSGRRLSTQELGFALTAMARAVEQIGESDEIRLAYTWNGDTHEVSTDKPIHEVSLPIDRAGSSPQLTVVNQGQATVFSRAIVSGLPEVGKETAAQEGLRVSVEYDDLDGEDIEVARIGHGTDFVAKVTVANTGRQALSELAMTHIVPSGWEIRNERMTGRGRGSSEEATFDHRDIRDDRVHTYFGLGAGETKTFEVRLHSAYPGRFYMPGITVEAMYDATVHGRTTGNWVEVVRPGLTG